MTTFSAFAPVPQLSPHEQMVFLLQLFVLLALALVLGRVAVRLGLPSVAGELGAGVLIGPSLFGDFAPGLSHWLFPATTSQSHLLDAYAQVGLLLLVGIAGGHLDLGLVRRTGRSAAAISIFGLVVPLGLGFGLGLLLPHELIPEGTDELRFAAFLGIALSVSAIPVIAKILLDLGLLHRDIGQLTLTSAMIDDALGWLLLSVVSATATERIQGAAIARPVLGLVGFLIVAFTLARPLLRRAFAATAGGGTGPAVATAVAAIVIGAATTQSLGLEPVFGAFVVGVLIASPGTVDPARLSPLHTMVVWVLAPLYFATAGLRADLGALREPAVAWSAVAVLAVAIVGKFAGAYAGARLSGRVRREGLALGAGLNARGVVQIVVATVGLRIGILSSAAYTIIVLVAVTTSIIAGPLLRRLTSGITQTPTEERRREIQARWLRAPATEA
ncbi:cation:proton antiporter [Nocardia sp. SYP-A9097]|uniref:cation:proton antiporter n=1 Tax=Nocardia sp. SYP-A9097 TaxID=2663237 RepID=UPI00129A490A|nr:cation:proton antiporter [Nocardia sp. SYP-A9097]MRH93590.1 cation:proton antiporter [Nocardia sp. SYP-A9097]